MNTGQIIVGDGGVALAGQRPQPAQIAGGGRPEADRSLATPAPRAP